MRLRRGWWRCLTSRRRVGPCGRRPKQHPAEPAGSLNRWFRHARLEYLGRSHRLQSARRVTGSDRTVRTINGVDRSGMAGVVGGSLLGGGRIERPAAFTQDGALPPSPEGRIPMRRNFRRMFRITQRSNSQRSCLYARLKSTQTAG